MTITEQPNARRLQWGAPKTLYHPDGGGWSKTSWEAEASWSTPLGPGRYRISHTSGGRDGDYGFYDVVRLKPTTSVFKFNGKPRKFHGYSLGSAQGQTAAQAIAERDNAKLVGTR
jgi:hypothetical protein